MSNNNKIKDDLKPFWKKVIPYAMVAGVFYIMGMFTGWLIG